MIVTCASCMTKFSLDDSKIPAKGAKVRCSKCQHVFFVTPPTESLLKQQEEEPMEDFETFIKSQKEFAEPGPKGAEIPRSKMDRREEIRFPGKKEGIGFPEEEEVAFAEEAPAKKEAPIPPFIPEMKERAEAKPVKPKRMIQRGRKKPPVAFLLIIFLILLVLGGVLLWTEYGLKEGLTTYKERLTTYKERLTTYKERLTTYKERLTTYKEKLSTYLENPIQKAIVLWDQMLGVKQEGLVWGGLNQYNEKVGDFFLSVIEGKVKNESQSARKYIKIRVQVFDEHNNKIAEKETLCGRNIGRDGLKSLPPGFFKGEMLIQPLHPRDMVVLTGKEVPFMVVFKDLTSQAREFKPEIIEAPNL